MFLISLVDDVPRGLRILLFPKGLNAGLPLKTAQSNNLECRLVWIKVYLFTISKLIVVTTIVPLSQKVLLSL